MNSDDLRAHLQEIGAQHGHLTPRIVLDAARPKNSPLHAAVFDRGVKEAAEEYYLERARRLIRHCRISYVQADDTEATVPEYVSVSHDRTPHRVYRRTDEIATDPLLAAMVLRNAERDWRTLKARYQHLAEFIELVRHDIDEMAA